MGVMRCDRNGCENIMCYRLSGKYGYICDECFDELQSRGGSANVKGFMNSDKEEVDKEGAYERYNAIFEIINYDE